MKKKLVIPTILMATILVAGMFAVMPVQKAETVHVAIIAAIGGAGGFTIDSVRAWVGGIVSESSGIADATGATTATILAESANQVRGTICVSAFTDAGTPDTLSIDLSIDGAGTFVTIITEAGAPDCVDFTGFGLQLAGSTLADADTVAFSVFSQDIET